MPFMFVTLALRKSVTSHQKILNEGLTQHRHLMMEMVVYTSISPTNNIKHVCQEQ